MTAPPPAAPDPGQDDTASARATAEAASPGAASARPRPRRAARLVHAVSDRVPTGWLTGILTIPFLAVTAAFGGLNAVAAPPPARLEAGETHRNAQLALTVERAVLIDELPEAGIFVEDGERVLALVVTAENRWDRAVAAHSETGVTGSLLVEEVERAAPESVARFDDVTTDPYLQPGLPVPLVLTWAVPGDAFADGDEVHVDVRDFSLRTGRLITYGESWDDPVTAAVLTVPITDVGSGVDGTDAG
ncbi:hypothetical protein AB3M83_13280 [Microbacterium sp. 179-B 1A2 NHS]|uniref:hypothetical protein n=1 Tax=Microbacterium sp. 179-B 1A2 NHS TaxID=3142383 RepID=UPI0039A23F73